MKRAKRVKPVVTVRPTRPEDFQGILDLEGRVYPDNTPWSEEQLAGHLEIFPEGQFVAVEGETQRVVGMAASLIVRWDEYEMQDSWIDFTDDGDFTNHDPAGRTLYGAEVMVDPDMRGRGVGKMIYRARRDLVRRLGLLRIRAGARLAGYYRYEDRMGIEEYVVKVVRGEIGDPTLSFQLRQGFRVIGVAAGYLPDDPQSHGYAAVIEWINHRVATRRDYARRARRFAKPRRRASPPPPDSGSGRP